MLLDTKKSSLPEPPCSLQCANNGYCAINPETSASHNFADGQLREMCICPDGYAGLTCLQPVELMDKCYTHEGNRICLNGGYCRQERGLGHVGDSGNVSNVSNGNNDSEWICDCAEANGVSPFAKDMCIRPHTEFCNQSGTAFCTNGGTCINNLVSQTTTIEYEGSDSCVCPDAFSGPHCEFLNELLRLHGFKTNEKGELDTVHGDTDPTTIPSGKEGNISIGEGEYRDKMSWGFGAALVVGAVAIIVFSVWKKKRGNRSQRNAHVDVHAHDNLDNDQFLRSKSGLRHEQFQDDNVDEEDYVMSEIALT